MNNTFSKIFFKKIQIFIIKLFYELITYSVSLRFIWTNKKKSVLKAVQNRIKLILLKSLLTYFFTKQKTCKVTFILRKKISITSVIFKVKLLCKLEKNKNSLYFSVKY